MVNALLLIAACLLTVLIVAPGKFSSLEVDEAALIMVALVAVTLVNVGIVHRFLEPLQALTALARRVELDKPGERVPDAQPTSEAGELALTFNEMLARLELERSEATRRVLAAHESERLRIAQELHDEVGQTLTAVLLQLSRLEQRMPDSLSGELSEAQDAARASLEDVRRIATDLRPEALKDLGLASALATLSDGFGRRTGLRVERQIQTPMPPLENEAELVVYRIAQEALTNVARHARSDTATLTVESDADRLTLTVRDHGCGLPERYADGNGMRGMHERAGLIGADLEIRTPSDGTGTELRFELPLRRCPVQHLKTRILLADDHSLVRRGLRLILDAQPDLEVVAEASDGAEAVKLALEPDVDLAILDISMPRMTGLQAARELRAAPPRPAHAGALDARERAVSLRGAPRRRIRLRRQAAADLDLIKACRATMRGEPFLYPAAVTALIADSLAARATARSPADPLTPRETEVIKLVAESYTNQQIADALMISEKTVERHRANILEKLGMHDRVELTRYAIRNGLVEA